MRESGKEAEKKALEMKAYSLFDVEEPTSDRYDCLPEKIAVVIPVRNRLDRLEQCLDSLKDQVFPKGRWEVLICDDGSTDEMAEVVARFNSILPNLRLLRQSPRGPAAARNLGLRSSSAGIFVCLDSDVVCAPDFLSRIIYALKMNPDWVAAEATVLPGSEQSSILWDAPESRGGAFLSAASAYRAEALRLAGGFDEEFKLPACEDADLAGRITNLGKYGYVPGAVVHHPVRRVSLGTHWRWRRHWKYEMFLAKRHGFLSFPGNPIGPFPRLRVAWAAVVTLPAGRFIEGVQCIRYQPRDGLLACLYALFDVFCGLCAVPTIFFSRVPPRRNYLTS